MRLKGWRVVVLVSTLLAASCGSTGSTHTPASSGGSKVPQAQPTQGETLASGHAGATQWTVRQDPPGPSGICQSVTFSGPSLTEPTTPAQACVPVPALRSRSSDPVELTWGNRAPQGGEPAYVAGLAAAGLHDLHLFASKTEVTVTLGKFGSFIGFASSKIDHLTFEDHGRTRTCRVEWPGGLSPVQTCGS